MKASINEQIAVFVEQLNAKQKKVVLELVKAFVEKNNTSLLNDDDFVKEMNKRAKEMESGKVKGYTWEEVKKRTRASVEKGKKSK